MDDNSFEVEASTPLLAAEQQANEASQFDLQPEAPLPSRRKRLLQIGLVMAALVVAVVIFGAPLAFRPTPNVSSVTPQPTLPARTALISSNINFGTVTINGK